MLPAGNSTAGRTPGRLLEFLFLLWLAGVSLRMTIRAMPPVIPRVLDGLHMSKTQVGLLVGLPLALFCPRRRAGFAAHRPYRDEFRGDRRHGDRGRLKKCLTHDEKSAGQVVPTCQRLAFRAISPVDLL